MTTLDCTDVKAILSALIDGVLDTAARHGAERHLAGCAECRALLDEVERADAALAEATGRATADRLPDGFTPSVLARTVYADRLSRPGHRGLGSWLGWIAAAACLALAVLTWIANHSPLPDRPSLPLRSTNYALGSQFRSWTHDGDPTEQELKHLQAPAPASPGTSETGSSSKAALAPLDADTVDSAAYLLQRLALAQVSSFADLETVRRAAEYDDIVPRLAAVRERLVPEDRTVVMAAEAVLFRLVNGPLDLTDAVALKDSVAELQIVQRLDQIRARRPGPSAL